MDLNSKVTLHTGNEMPILGIGSWLLKDPAQTIALGLELGYRMVDTSSDYGTQPGVGEGIRQSGLSRDELFVVTKVEEMDDAYDRAQSNLEELKLDYVDLLLIHRPPPNGAGEALWDELIKAQEEGLTRDIGVSNYSAKLIDRLIEVSNVVPVVNQIEWSPFGHSMEMKHYCDEKQIVIQAYSSLTHGKRDDDSAIEQIADQYHKSPAQVLIRWNLQLGTVPLIKANQRQHLEENLDVFDFELSEEDMTAITNLNEQYSALGSLKYL